MGNMFARQSGSMKLSAPMIAMGSHLDTQPRGGRYDGILGVVAAVEVLRTMKESGFRTNYDVGIVNWTKYVFFHCRGVDWADVGIARKGHGFQCLCVRLVFGLVVFRLRKLGTCAISMTRVSH